jgi:adenylate cyclase class 2
MYEVELKVRADHDPVRERLRELGADPAGAVEQVDTYFDHPGREFAETDEALRVREVRPLDDGEDAATGDAAATAETRVTYKGPLVDDVSKTREEIETGVDDRGAVETILERLSFEPAATVRKRRERFRLDGYTVTLDDVEGLATFVEVEREVAEGVDAAREGAVETLDRLGLDPDDGIRTSYLGLLLDDGATDDPRE